LEEQSHKLVNTFSKDLMGRKEATGRLHPRDLHEAHSEDLRHCDEFVNSDQELSGTIHHRKVKNAELFEDLLVIETYTAENARLEDVSDVHFGGINDYDSDSDDEFGGDESKDDD
jgi:hypothetical protein